MSDELDRMQEQEAFINGLQIQAVRRRSRQSGISLAHCEQCGNDIPVGRQIAVPGVRVCVECQRVSEFLIRQSLR